MRWSFKEVAQFLGSEHQDITERQSEDAPATRKRRGRHRQSGGVFRNAVRMRAFFCAVSRRRHVFVTAVCAITSSLMSLPPECWPHFSSSAQLRPNSPPTSILLSTSPSPDLFSRLLFLSRPIPLWPCVILSSACLATLSSLPLNVSQAKFTTTTWLAVRYRPLVSIHPALSRAAASIFFQLYTQL